MKKKKDLKIFLMKNNLGSMALVQQDETWFMRRLVNLHKMKRPIGKIIVNPDLCKDCKFCIEFCPNGFLRSLKTLISRVITTQLLSQVRSLTV